MFITISECFVIIIIIVVVVVVVNNIMNIVSVFRLFVLCLPIGQPNSLTQSSI